MKSIKLSDENIVVVLTRSEVITLCTSLAARRARLSELRYSSYRNLEVDDFLDKMHDEVNNLYSKLFDFQFVY